MDNGGVISLFSIKITDKSEYAVRDKCIVTESYALTDSDDPFYDHKSTDPSADALARLLRPQKNITELFVFFFFTELKTYHLTYSIHKRNLGADMGLPCKTYVYILSLTVSF